MLGAGVATGFVLFQSGAFLVGAGGMLVDRILKFPNGRLVEGKTTCLACPETCGFALTAHGLWHILAIVGAALTLGAREFAMAS